MNKPTEKQRKTIHAEQIAPQNKRKKEPVEKQRKAKYDKIADITDRSVLISRTKNYAKQHKSP